MIKEVVKNADEVSADFVEATQEIIDANGASGGFLLFAVDEKGHIMARREMDVITLLRLMYFWLSEPDNGLERGAIRKILKTIDEENNNESN